VVPMGHCASLESDEGFLLAESKLNVLKCSKNANKISI